jgi:hypothetical protein
MGDGLIAAMALSEWDGTKMEASRHSGRKEYEADARSSGEIECRAMLLLLSASVNEPPVA